MVAAFDLQRLIQLILILGAINVGMMAFNGVNLVDKVSFGHPEYTRYINCGLGLAGLYSLYLFLRAM